MAHSDHMTVAEGNSVDGTRLLVEESSPTIGSSSFVSAKDELICSSAEAAAGAASLPSDPSSEYFSHRIQSIMESRSQFGTNLEAEIEASKSHWSELEGGQDGKSTAEANLELFQSLQSQYGGPKGFFADWKANLFALGEKIAEGAQGEIFHMKYVCPDHSHVNDKFVFKAFKEGSRLEDLQKQWPQGMLLKISNLGKPYYECEGCTILRGMIFEDGRFGFAMLRRWGDLRKVIDLRMQHNKNRAPPFEHERAFVIMYQIASGMRGLHQDNIVHRDLKASNVLIMPSTWNAKDLYEEFNPTNNDDFYSSVADFECAVGVVGTRFWRALEILLGVKNGNVEPSLFTEKSDVYSYAMTCYEVLIGDIPFEDSKCNKIDFKDYFLLLCILYVLF